MKLNFKNYSFDTLHVPLSRFINLLMAIPILSFVFSCVPEDILPDTNYIPVIVQTTNSTQVSFYSARIGGIISAPQERNLTRGVCWSTFQNPNYNNYKITDQGGIGTFSFTLNGLQPGTTYFVKAFAVSQLDIATVDPTVYGDQLSFTTLSLQLASISTLSITSVTSVSATCGGNITSDGGASVTARGVCWSTSQNPTIADSRTFNGTGVGSFTSSITGLIPVTTYYFRAYATNAVGTVYGTQVYISTPATLATLSTTSISSVTSTSVITGGYISSDGGASVSARGVCWSTSQNPTIADSRTSNGTGMGSFTSSITGLVPVTTYYFRAYATNSVGTVYGTQISITTPANLATLSTSSVSSITSVSAICGGNITSDGGASVAARGICWGNTQNPTIADSRTTNGTGTGSFTSLLTGLVTKKTYYVRAYATNSAGTSYGNNVVFATN